MAVELLVLTNTDRRFYPTLGPFLANRDVVKAVGGPIWDDDAKTWLVLRDNRKGVLGFCAVSAQGGRMTVESLYTRQGLSRVASELVGAVAAKYGARDLHAVVRHEYARAYLDAGFKPTSQTKGFARLTRPRDGATNA